MYFLHHSIRWFGILAILPFLTGCTSKDSGTATTNQNKTLQIVKNLGRNDKTTQDYKNHVVMLQQLAARPQTSVEMLVKELEPVAIVKLNYSTNNPTENAKAHHVIWCFRALYYVTRHEIRATSSYKLTDSEMDQNRSGLVVRDDGRWSFFTEWMSQGADYFAPLDAQKKIIEEWRKWAKQNATTYHYPKDVELKDWYFGGP